MHLRGPCFLPKDGFLDACQDETTTRLLSALIVLSILILRGVIGLFQRDAVGGAGFLWIEATGVRITNPFIRSLILIWALLATQLLPVP